MKRFLIQTSIEKAEGSQTWYVDAETETEALKKYKDGDCDVYQSEVEVTSLGEPELVGETSLDDFGDCVTTPQRTWIDLTDEEVRQICGSVPALKEAVREAGAKLKEKNT